MKTILSIIVFLVFTGNFLFGQVIVNLTPINATCYGACNGSITSSVTGGTPPYTYLWSNTQTIPNPTGLCAGTYMVTVTDAAAASGTFSATVAQPPILTAIISASTNVSCYGGTDGTATISASGGTPPYMYNWSNGVTIPEWAGMAGTYTVTVTDSNGCTATTSVTITEPPVLTVSITSSTNASCNGMCDGTATTTVSGGTSPYSCYWVNGQTTLTTYNVCAGNYGVSISDANGCTTTATATITEPAALTPSITGTLSYCAGSSTTLDAGSGYSIYSWSPSGNTQIINVTSAGNYSVTVTDANGCFGTDNVTVTENSLPTVYAGVDMTVCEGTAVTLSGSGAMIYTWDNSVTDGTPFTPLSTTTYTVTGTNGNGCTNTDQVVVTVNALPTVNAGADQTVCAGTSVTLSGSGNATSYLWDNGVTDGTPFTPTNTTTYTVIGTDANGCTNTDTVLVTVNALAILSGTVSYSGGNIPAGDGIVNLFKQSTGGGGQFDSIASQTITSTGYLFNNLMPGNYHISVVLTNPALYPNLLTTYYNNHFLWTDADTIILVCNDNISLPITMYEFVSSPPGNCDLSGTIVYGNYSGFKSTKAVGEPVPGAEILIEQEPNDVPIQSVITDNNGFYLLSNIAEGFGYHLLVDIPGYPILSTYLNITINNTDTLLNNLNFIFDTSSTGGIFIDTATGFSNLFINSGIVSMNVFPNPFANQLNINFELSQNVDIVVELISINGSQTKELLNKTNCKKGSYNYSVTIPQNFAEGNYLLKIKAGNNVIVKKLILKK